MEHNLSTMRSLSLCMGYMSTSMRVNSVTQKPWTTLSAVQSAARNHSALMKYGATGSSAGKSISQQGLLLAICRRRGQLVFLGPPELALDMRQSRHFSERLSLWHSGA